MVSPLFVHKYRSSGSNKSCAERFKNIEQLQIKVENYDKVEKENLERRRNICLYVRFTQLLFTTFHLFFLNIQIHLIFIETKKSLNIYF